MESFTSEIDMSNSFSLKKQINVKGTDYKIIRKKNPKDDDGKIVLGLFDPEAKTITIATGLAIEIVRQTFIHELFHAYIYECHLREGIDTQLEEVIVEALTQAIEEKFHIKWR